MTKLHALMTQGPGWIHDLSQMFGQRIQIDEAGEVTPESLDWLRSQHPFLAIDALARPITPEGLKDLLTVEAITELVAAAEPHNVSEARGSA